MTSALLHASAMSKQTPLFLVHLSSRCGCSWPAVFGECLIDQIRDSSVGYCRKCSQHNQLSICGSHKCKSREDCGGKCYRTDEKLLDRNKTNSLVSEQGLQSNGKLCNDNISSVKETEKKHCSRLTCQVIYSMKESHLVISEVAADCINSIMLRHPEFCPTRLQHLNNLNSDTTPITLLPTPSPINTTAATGVITTAPSINSTTVRNTTTAETTVSEISQTTTKTEPNESARCLSDHTENKTNSTIYCNSNAAHPNSVLQSSGASEHETSTGDTNPSNLAESLSTGLTSASTTSPATSLFTNRGVAVGVSVLVESSDGKVLMTRRARHMRTFPGVWVPPGGHVEHGESLATAGLRELQEETGVAPAAEVPVQVLGLWESVYPPLLGMGSPTRQHLVVYLHLRLPCPAAQVQLKLQSSEVDAIIWLAPPLVELVLCGSSDPNAAFPAVLPATVLDVAGGSVAGEVDTEWLRQRLATRAGSNGGRLSTGSRFALGLWLKGYQSRRPSQL